MTGRVAVIVPTRNAAATIGACLESIKKQTVRAHELYVIDGGSLDETAAIANAKGAQVLRGPANRSAQRNLGASAASSEFLLFVDADMELSTNVIEKCLSSMRPGTVALAIPEESQGTTFWASVKAFERSFYQGLWWMEAARWYQRDVFAEAGGFDPELVGPEDWDLDERIRSLGSVGYADCMIVHREGALDLHKLREKKRHYAATVLAYARKHPKRAALQLGLMNRIGVFAKQPARLIRHPLLSLGLMVMGLAELGSAQRHTYSEDSERPIYRWEEDDE